MFLWWADMKISLKTGDEEWLGDLAPIDKPYGTLDRVMEQVKLLLVNLDTVNKEYVITVEVEDL